jgi:hypothetical protein
MTDLPSTYRPGRRAHRVLQAMAHEPVAMAGLSEVFADEWGAKIRTKLNHILSALVRDELIERVPGGYSLTDEGHEVLRDLNGGAVFTLSQATPSVRVFTPKAAA